MKEESKRGKIGKGRKFDRVQKVAIGKDERGNIVYKHIFHRTANMK